MLTVLSQSASKDSLSLQPHNQPKAGPAASPCVCPPACLTGRICLSSCCRAQTGSWNCLQMFHREIDYFPDWWICAVVNIVSLVRGDPWSIMWKDSCFIWEGVQDPKKRMHLADTVSRVIQTLRGRGGRLDPQPQPMPLQGLPSSGCLQNPKKGVVYFINQPLLWICFSNEQRDTIIRNALIFLVLTCCESQSKWVAKVTLWPSH